MKKRKLLVTGGLATTLLIGGAGSAYAQTIETAAPRPSKVIEHYAEIGYDASSRPDMSDFGLDASDVLTDADLEAASRQMLIDEGFTPAQIYKIFTRARLEARKAPHADI